MKLFPSDKVESMTAALAERPRYQSPGGMRWSRLPVLLAVPLVVALGVGWVLARLFFIGWYVVPLVTLGGCGAIFGAMFFSVGWTHLRSALMGGVLGLVFGATAFISSYYFDFLRRVPAGMGDRLDQLPAFIHFRMQTDVGEENPPRPKQRQAQPHVGSNYFHFCWELAMYMAVAAAGGAVRAGRPYELERSLWAKRERIRIAPGSGAELIERFLAGDATGFNETFRQSKGNNQSLSECALDFFEPEGVSPLEYPAYLTIYDSPWRYFWQTLVGSPKAFRRIELTAQETLAISAVFPKLQSALAKAHSQLAHIADPGAPGRAAPVAEDSGGAVGEFQTLPEPDKGRITGGGYVWISNLSSLASLIPGLVGGGLVYAAYRVVDGGGNEVAGVVLGVSGALGIIATGILGLYYNTVPENLYQRAKIRKVLRSRETTLVAVDDPEAFPIAITLRENWTRIKLVQESDCGLMLIDERRTELRFEGDHERFRLPGAAILTCEPELFFHPIDKNTEFWLIRLVARTSQGMREVLLQQTHLDWKPATNKRRRANATDLAMRIGALGNLVVTVELAEADAG